MSLAELEEENKFRTTLKEFWNSKGITQIKIPQIGGQQLNLFKLYKSVCAKGGGQSVSHNKLWKEIVDQFGLPSTCTSASFTLKNHYQKYLLGYEQRMYFGKDDCMDLPELVAGRTRKIRQGDFSDSIPKISGTENQVSQAASLKTELTKAYQKCDPNQKIHYIKRTKMYPVMSEIKHIMLALQTKDPSQITYAINMLLLFSVNTQAPFLFSQYPNVVEIIAAFLRRVYPYKNVFALEATRNLTVIIRNLAINFKNLSPIIDSPLIDILQQMFTDKLDRQITRNVVDIFNSLTKIGWDQCSKGIYSTIETYLNSDSSQDLATGLDLLRSLAQHNQQQCQQIIKNKADFFCRLLIPSNLAIRETVLEIFAYLSDRSRGICQLCLNNIKFLRRLVALLSDSTGQYQRQAQLACYILNTLSQNPRGISILRQFEQELVMVSFNDQLLSPIMSELLYVMSGRHEEEKFQSSEGAKKLKKQNILMQKMREQINNNQLEEEDYSD